MPAALPEARLAGVVAQAQMDLVAGDDRGNEFASRVAFAFTERERHRQIAARVRRVAPSVVVVEVEVAQRRAVGEDGESAAGLAAASYDGGLRPPAEPLGHLAHRDGRAAVDPARRAPP